MTSIIYLGLDVHKDSVTIAVLPAGATAPTRIDKYPNDFAKLRRLAEPYAKDGVPIDKFNAGVASGAGPTAVFKAAFATFARTATIAARLTCVPAKN